MEADKMPVPAGRITVIDALHGFSLTGTCREPCFSNPAISCSALLPPLWMGGRLYRRLSPVQEPSCRRKQHGQQHSLHTDTAGEQGYSLI